VWLLLGLGIFTLIPTKLPGYVLPLLPAAVLLMAAAPRRPAWSLRLVGLQLILLSLALPAALIAARRGALGVFGQDLLATPGIATGLGLIGSLALVAALLGWRSSHERERLAALVLSMLLLVCSLPALAGPYRHLQQQPVLELAQAAHRLHGSAHVLYVLGRPRYSVVPIADLPTIFGSPRRPASPRPDSSFLNWKLHGRDREALVLGGCPSIEALEHDRSVHLTLLEQRRTFCLARLQRTASPSLASAEQPG
jgi:4-amino-4-deoxy-L-arabinose transferase-like glycosyltransferase